MRTWSPGHRCLSRSTMRLSGPVTPAGGSALPGLNWAKIGQPRQMMVERQETVVAVVAVEEAALLAALHRIAGQVDFEHESGRTTVSPGIDERLERRCLQGVRIMADPAVAIRRAARRRMFDPVQRALRRQRRAVLAMPLELAGEQGQNRVVPQLVVVVEVFVSHGDPHDALRHQRLDRVLDETGIAVVGEATPPPSPGARSSGRPREAATPPRSK